MIISFYKIRLDGKINDIAENWSAFQFANGFPKFESQILRRVAEGITQ